MNQDKEAERYAEDIIYFLEHEYWIPEIAQFITLEEWQKEWILKPLFYDLNPDGSRKYNIALLGMPKKNGKSALAGGIGIYMMYCDEAYGEIIIAANAKDQASKIIYNKMRRSITANPTLRQGTIVSKEELEVKSTGTITSCIAHEYTSAAGLNPNCTLFDELWAFRDRKFYDELTVVPTRKNPLVVIVTYAGYEQQGLLWELYKDGMNGETVIDTGDPEVIVRRGKNDPKMFMFWSNKNLASWVSKDYLKAQIARLPPVVYARLHKNRWTKSGQKFITENDIDAMHRIPWVLQTKPIPNPLFTYVVATDLGLSHDRAARVVLHFNAGDGNIYVDSIRLWEGTPEEHVDIGEVELDLIDCSHQFNAKQLVVDPWQMEYVIQRLEPFYNIIPFNFSAQIQHLSQIFVNMIQSQRVICYNEPQFDQELRDIIIKQTVQGWRIDHTGKRKNDIVVSIGMAMTEAIKEQFGSLALSELEKIPSKVVGFDNIRTKTF